MYIVLKGKIYSQDIALLSWVVNMYLLRKHKHKFLGFLYQMESNKW